MVGAGSVNAEADYHALRLERGMQQHAGNTLSLILLVERVEFIQGHQRLLVVHPLSAFVAAD